MNTTHRLNLLLSDILRDDSTSKLENSPRTSMQTSTLLTFAEYDHHPTTTPGKQRRHNVTTPRHHHQLYQADAQRNTNNQSLLNSSTLDDLFRAFSLECEQCLATPSTSSFPNQNYEQSYVKLSKPASIHIDSNDEDYENLQNSKLRNINGSSKLKTSIQVTTPEKEHVVSMTVSSKQTAPLAVTSSQTYPLLLPSCANTTVVTTGTRHSSCEEENSVDLSMMSVNRRRRRRVRKQIIPHVASRSSSSDEEPTDTTNGLIHEKRSTATKRSFSTDYRQQRVKSIYDNHPVPIPTQKVPSRRVRRRDISLQQHMPITTKHYEDDLPKFPSNLCSPLSVLLTSTKTTSDFVNRPQQQSRQSRHELVKHEPISSLNRIQQPYYRSLPIHYNDIPTHQIPSYPVY